MNTLPALSVVIPSYWRCALLKRLLQALLHQTLAPDEYEVIVVIDGSQDGTREMVASFAAPYTLRSIWQPNQGRAAACNAGIRAAAGALVVLLDDDMEPAPDFLAAHRQAHAHETRLGVIGAAPIRFDQSSPPIIQFVGSKFNQHLDKLAQTGRPVTLRDFYSGNFSIGREVLLEVGAFDEAFKIYGNEDLELAVRFAQSNVRLIYDSDAIAFQNYEKDLSGLAWDNFAKGQTAVLLATKHPWVYSQLRLSTYAYASRKWRLLRAGLLGLTRVWSRTPDVVIRVVRSMDRNRSARLNLIYSFAVDYFYWLGVRSARRQAQCGKHTGPLAERAGGTE